MGMFFSERDLFCEYCRRKLDEGSEILRESGRNYQLFFDRESCAGKQAIDDGAKLERVVLRYTKSDDLNRAQQ